MWQSSTTFFEERIRRHDRFQFEVKRIFSFSTSRDRYTRYRVDTFFFIPSSLHINKNTWSKEDFYRNLKTNIRLRTPTYALADLAGAESDPMLRLHKAASAVLTKPSDKHITSYKYHVKLFSLIFKRSLRMACYATCHDKNLSIQSIRDFTAQTTPHSNRNHAQA